MRVYKLKYRAPAIGAGLPGANRFELITWWAILLARSFREAVVKADRCVKKHPDATRIESLEDLGEVEA